MKNILSKSAVLSLMAGAVMLGSSHAHAMDVEDLSDAIPSVANALAVAQQVPFSTIKEEEQIDPTPEPWCPWMGSGSNAINSPRVRSIIKQEYALNQLEGDKKVAFGSRTLPSGKTVYFPWVLASITSGKGAYGSIRGIQSISYAFSPADGHTCSFQLVPAQTVLGQNVTFPIATFNLSAGI